VPRGSQVRPGLFTRFVPVAGRDGQLPPIQTTSVSETPPTPLGRAGQALKRLVVGLPLDASAIAVERMRKLVALPVLLWVPTISSTSRDQAIFVDRATGASLSSYAVLPENDRLRQRFQRGGGVERAVRPVLIVATRGRTW
jgi:hypothetical protein